jgi:hypothetical protein
MGSARLRVGTGALLCSQCPAGRAFGQFPVWSGIAADQWPFHLFGAVNDFPKKIPSCKLKLEIHRYYGTEQPLLECGGFIVYMLLRIRKLIAATSNDLKTQIEIT